MPYRRAGGRELIVKRLTTSRLHDDGRHEHQHAAGQLRRA
jgi:hypothetical protein